MVNIKNIYFTYCYFCIIISQFEFVNNNFNETGGYAVLIRNREQDLETILFAEPEIAHRAEELGKELDTLLNGERPIMACVLKGAVFFFTDLCRRMESPVDLDFIQVSSYGSGTTSSGKIRLKKDMERNVEGRTVVLVEDIVDSGLTLRYLGELLKERGAARVLTVAFLDRGKPATDLKGFSVGGEFVVGYGLDYAEHYRNLPYIAALKPECYTDEITS